MIIMCSIIPSCTSEDCGSIKINPVEGMVRLTLFMVFYPNTCLSFSLYIQVKVLEISVTTRRSKFKSRFRN